MTNYFQCNQCLQIEPDENWLGTGETLQCKHCHQTGKKICGQVQKL
jgi:hypothetical protein